MTQQYGQDLDSYTVEQMGMTSYPSQSTDREGPHEMAPHMGSENENPSAWKQKSIKSEYNITSTCILDTLTLDAPAY